MCYWPPQWIRTKVPKSRKKPLANFHHRMSLLWSFSSQIHAFSWSFCTYSVFKFFLDRRYGHSFKVTPTSLDVFWSQQKPRLKNRWKNGLILPTCCLECNAYEMWKLAHIPHILSPLSWHSELTLPYASLTASWLWVLPKLFLEFWGCLWKTDLHYIC